MWDLHYFFFKFFTFLFLKRLIWLPFLIILSANCCPAYPVKDTKTRINSFQGGEIYDRFANKSRNIKKCLCFSARDFRCKIMRFSLFLPPQRTSTRKRLILVKYFLENKINLDCPRWAGQLNEFKCKQRLWVWKLDSKLSFSVKKFLFPLFPYLSSSVEREKTKEIVKHKRQIFFEENTKRKEDFCLMLISKCLAAKESFCLNSSRGWSRKATVEATTRRLNRLKELSLSP